MERFDMSAQDAQDVKRPKASPKWLERGGKDLAPCGGTWECYDAHDWMSDYIDIHHNGRTIADVREKRRRMQWREKQAKQHGNYLLASRLIHRDEV